MPGSWLIRPRPNPSARVRLACIPYAGGGTSIYRSWVPLLPPHVELCLAQLPGREARFNEPLVRSCAEVVDPLVAALAGLEDKPLALFGHSMGALVAFELAKRLEQTPGVNVLALFASGRRAPHVDPHIEPWHSLPDDKFLATVRRLNGTPAEVFENAELMSLMMPILRADLAIDETHRLEPGPSLRCAVVALGGRNDSMASPSSVEAWREYAAGPFRAAFCDGGHFFVQHERGFVLREISAELSARAT
jgi:medium-chain acyl-[acyl-carrier-protein] hydrolase